MSLSRDFEEFLVALNDYHEIALENDNPNSDEVLDAADALVEAFTVYDESLFNETGIDLPLDAFEIDDEYDEENLNDEYDEDDEDWELEEE